MDTKQVTVKPKQGSIILFQLTDFQNSGQIQFEYESEDGVQLQKTRKILYYYAEVQQQLFETAAFLKTIDLLQKLYQQKDIHDLLFIVFFQRTNEQFIDVSPESRVNVVIGFDKDLDYVKAKLQIDMKSIVQEFYKQLVQKQKDSRAEIFKAKFESVHSQEQGFHRNPATKCDITHYNYQNIFQNQLQHTINIIYDRLKEVYALHYQMA